MLLLSSKIVCSVILLFSIISGTSKLIKSSAAKETTVELILVEIIVPNKIIDIFF